MFLKKITLLNFKNVAREELTFCPGINGLVAAAQNAASFSSIWPQALHLGILAAGYGLAAYWLYLRRAQQHLALGSAKPVYRSNNA